MLFNFNYYLKYIIIITLRSPYKVIIESAIPNTLKYGIDNTYYKIIYWYYEINIYYYKILI